MDFYAVFRRTEPMNLTNCLISEKRQKIEESIAALNSINEGNKPKWKLKIKTFFVSQNCQNIFLERKN